MAGIESFRHLFVYPPLMRDFARGGKQIGRTQAEQGRSGAEGTANNNDV